MKLKFGDPESIKLRDTVPVGTCKKCLNQMEHTDCDECGGDGLTEHDCGDDTCCCLDPEPNVECWVCDGLGGWWTCWPCHNKEE